ncbi:MAG: Holliday junction resolvase RuvX [Clostridiales bacterium]|nr:Holliday junction resolvase RuvX [Clostridiales bacterium]
MTRYLGLDYGNVRLGVAISDESGRFARPHGVILHSGWGPTARAVARLMQELQAASVVMGLPYTMEGELGEQAQEVLGFTEVLKNLGVAVILQDERLSSFEAQERLRERGKSIAEMKTLVDQEAAAIILQTWLDENRVH